MITKHIPINKTRDEVVRMGMEWIGTPYMHRAAVKGKGVDCLGLIRGILKEIHGEDIVKPLMPNYQQSWHQIHYGEPFLRLAGTFLERSKRASLEGLPADVIVIRPSKKNTYKHCGILTSSNTMIHAYAGNEVVKYTIPNAWLRDAQLFQFPGIKEN